MSEFSIWLYHEQHGPKLFTDEASILLAGDGWYDSPAKFGTPWESVISAPVRTRDADGVMGKSAVELAAEVEPDPRSFDPAAITPNPDPMDDDDDVPVASHIIGTVVMPEAAKRGRPRKS